MAFVIIAVRPPGDEILPFLSALNRPVPTLLSTPASTRQYILRIIQYLDPRGKPPRNALTFFDDPLEVLYVYLVFHGATGVGVADFCTTAFLKCALLGGEARMYRLDYLFS